MQKGMLGGFLVGIQWACHSLWLPSCQSGAYRQFAAQGLLDECKVRIRQ